ncbi:MAG TPA: insulinase family protein [Spirochaetes bacterium]|nr:insulinase family protein [Spirochaetota bacterium]
MIKYSLENGMTVLLQPVEGVVSISVGLWIKTGSRDERENERGYAHFVEHMLFKGTSQYSAKDIARIVDRVGGQHNAATNREYTCYYINVVSDFLDMSVKLIADMYYNSLFDDDEIGKEKNVIIEEIRMYEDTPDELIHDVFMECMLARHPLGHSILGTQASIKGTNREKLVGFYQDHYGTDNVVFVIVGNFNIEEARASIDRYFQGSFGRTDGRLPTHDPSPGKIRRRHIPKDLEQVHFCLGTEGLKRDDDSRWGLYILSTILGGSMSSRLFQNIREKEGLCYSVYSFHSSYKERGIFGIYCGTSPENYDRALELILKECRAVVETGITAEELEDAKTFMIGNLALSLESNEVRMGQLAKNEMVYGRDFPFLEIAQKINSVTLDDFNRIGHYLFADKELTLVTIGKLPSGVEDVASIRI